MNKIFLNVLLAASFSVQGNELIKAIHVSDVAAVQVLLEQNTNKFDDAVTYQKLAAEIVHVRRDYLVAGRLRADKGLLPLLQGVPESEPYEWAGRGCFAALGYGVALATYDSTTIKISLPLCAASLGGILYAEHRAARAMLRHLEDRYKDAVIIYNLIDTKIHCGVPVKTSSPKI